MTKTFKKSTPEQVDTKKRNRQIVKMRDRGIKFYEIAGKFGITTSRAVQINQRERIARPRKVQVSLSEIAHKYHTTPEKLEILSA